MENLVVSLETAKKLKAAGFTQYTKLGWYRSGYDATEWHVVIDSIEPSDNWLAAPTAQEIADQLPAGMNILKQRTLESEDELVYIAQRGGGGHGVPWFDGPTMAEALALLWLKLRSNND